MAVVTNIELHGECWKGSMRYAGYGLVYLDNGDTVYVAESDAKGFEGCLVNVESKGHDTTQFRKDMKEWVKTGKFRKQPMNFTLRG